jgi:hypothetical protein
VSSALSDPLVATGLLLGLAGLMLVIGLALQERASRRAGRSLFWQESADGDGDRRDETVEAAQAPATPEVTPEAAKAPVANDRPPEDQGGRQELDTQLPALDSLTSDTAAISAIDEMEERLNTWIERMEAGAAPAQEPQIAPPQEPVANDQPSEKEEPVTDQWPAVTNEQPPEVTPEQPPAVTNKQPPTVTPDQSPEDWGGWVEEPESTNGSDGGSANGSDGGRAPNAPSPDVSSENGVQDKDRRWLEEFIARTKSTEESCGRADDAVERLMRMIEPPPSESAE